MKATRHEACEAVLGAIITFGKWALEIAIDEHLRPDDFYRIDQQRIYRAALHLHDAGQPVDSLMVKSRLEDEIAAGDKAWHDPLHASAVVDALTGPIPDLGSLRGYAAIIRTESAWDMRGQAMTEAAEAISRRDGDAFTAAIARIDQASGKTVQHTHSPEQLADQFVDWIENEDGHGAITTGLRELDEILAGGFRRGDTTVLGAWSSQGKSVIVDQWLHAAHDESGARAAVYLNEMDRMDRTARTVARMTQVAYPRLISRQLGDKDRRQVIDAMGRLPFTIVECAGWSAAEIARDIRRNRWDVAAVDLVTRIPARDTADWDVISGTLTDVARQTGTHLVLVCQLNQERNKAAIKPPPVMRDLRGTGAWGNDAANVIFLHRDQEMVEHTGLARTVEDGHVRVEKCRHGRPGELVQVTFNPARMIFQPLSDFREPVVAAA